MLIYQIPQSNGGLWLMTKRRAMSYVVVTIFFLLFKVVNSPLLPVTIFLFFLTAFRRALLFAISSHVKIGKNKKQKQVLCPFDCIENFPNDNMRPFMVKTCWRLCFFMNDLYPSCMIQSCKTLLDISPLTKDDFILTQRPEPYTSVAP